MTSSNVSTAWTDGSSVGNPGPGGWAALVDGQLFCGHLPHATNNYMEVLAIYQALFHCPDTAELLIVMTDSKIAEGWLSKGWKVHDNPPIAKLLACYFDLLELKGTRVAIQRVRGHAGIPENEQVDLAAGKAARTVLPARP